MSRKFPQKYRRKWFIFSYRKEMIVRYTAYDGSILKDSFSTFHSALNWALALTKGGA
jgi:hypothetical protein